MKFETLKKLIESEFAHSSEVSTLKEKILVLLSLYESDNKLSEDEEYTLIPYHHLCGCNPVNGGSGVCGCGIGNIQVKSSFKEEIYESVRKEREQFK